ncbi:MAG: flagellar assembly protein T N-terminal domain-containing protein [Halanaerobiales bacterium]|nr:flagellar assembly protein T N-terminal domain-containing protein [Halanaerobiales bacterium]
MNHKNKWFLLIAIIVICILISPISLAVSKKKEEKIQISATGLAPISTNKGIAKEEALMDAFRNAMEQALGVRITAFTVMENLTITKDVVMSQTWGNLLSYEIIEEKESKGTYFITISAEVSSDARWWAEFEGTLDVVRLHVKDLVIRDTYTIPDPIQSGGLYYDQILVIPVRGKEHYLVAVHAKSKHIMWKMDLSGRLTAPLSTNGDWGVAITKEEVIVFNLKYGWVHWKYTPEDTIYQTAAITKDAIYLTTQRGKLLALGTKKGNLLWQYRTDGFFLSQPTIAGDQIYFGDSSGYLYSLDLNRQSLVYKKMISPNFNITSTRILNFLTYNDDYDQILAINSVDGSNMWSYKGKFAGSSATAHTPKLIQGKVLALFTQSKKSRMYLFDAKSGYLYWEKELDFPATEIAGVGNGIIILNSWNGIRIYDLEFGNPLWESSSSGVKVQLMVGEDRLFYLHDTEVDVYK